MRGRESSVDMRRVAARESWRDQEAKQKVQGPRKRRGNDEGKKKGVSLTASFELRSWSILTETVAWLAITVVGGW